MDREDKPQRERARGHKLERLQQCCQESWGVVKCYCKRNITTILMTMGSQDSSSCCPLGMGEGTPFPRANHVYSFPEDLQLDAASMISQLRGGDWATGPDLRLGRTEF